MNKSRFQFSLFLLLCLSICSALLFAAFGWRRISEPEHHCKVIDIRAEQVSNAWWRDENGQKREMFTSICYATCATEKHTFELRLTKEFSGLCYSGELPLSVGDEFKFASLASKLNPNFIQLPDATCIIKIEDKN